MDVQVFDEQSALKLDTSLIQAVASQVVATEGLTFDEVSIHLVDIPTISSLHEQYFDDPTPTDCISFPMDDDTAVGYRVLGDVFVCPEVAIEYSKAHELNPFEETILYVVHGLLHLLGYDDIEDTDRAKMREAEQRHLAGLKKSGII